MKLRQKNGLTGVVIKSFKVPREFLDTLRATSIHQDDVDILDRKRVRARRVDTTKAIDQFELPPNWMEALREVIEQGTGVVETPEDLRIP